jgi:hypothetical protein
MSDEQLQRKMMIEILTKKHKTSHILHLLLSVVTGGLWVPVWILVTVSDAIERGKVERAADSDTYAHRLGRFVGSFK